MSKSEKLIQRFLGRPKDFSYDELRKLFSGFGYIEDNSGKSSGSRVAWIHSETKHIIRLHKPHPKNILKSYQINQILDELKSEGYIK
ncbi:type II toxin-antitoxin system HicA family toxin [Leptospira noguchii]|uniref:Putative toxin-antitoxin system, toxin component, HicA family n=2 Tax=Leptospira noguchii TaxID=28182 RepID=M6V8T9_9LEPT|nr:type II toxin-antitoxin system HicA family toxin [Leptospira noguchii]EMO53837.1 putative toxin-antitoxin system, toxin component, HicA family [Leptospira noguchii]EQA71193.1 putative toxin-antitoxin system, toxin component, HicA family [Leptospira noguchii serovar Panama str. CZ214]TQE76541.1 type II toxin-antitoxin system HicA family toxin [Leptospira noguchii]UOG31081.1 type II toxin-antitoxin system HicA family toxin [Leptospira noguchii]UOG53232.1 type II toxin-antitoxin system HicA fa